MDLYYPGLEADPENNQVLGGFVSGPKQREVEGLHGGPDDCKWLALFPSVHSGALPSGDPGASSRYLMRASATYRQSRRGMQGTKLW